MTLYVRSDDKGVLLSIRLSPGASRNQIMGTNLDATGKSSIKISVTAAPEKGKANSALINLLAKFLKHPKSDFEIVSGTSNRSKTVRIVGDSAYIEAELAQKLD